MKRILLTSVAGVALLAAGAISASAADLYRKAPPVVAPPPPPPPAFSWTGCYTGVHTGWGWGEKKFRDARRDQYFIDTSSSVRESKLDTSGPLFGGQLGCDYQFGFGKGAGLGNWVIGIQGSIAGADINGHDIDGVDTFSSEQADGSMSLHAKTDFLADLTGRLGFSWWSTSLLYVKGGVAWDHTRYLALASAFPSFTEGETHAFAARETRTGAVFGVGWEWAFAPNWSAFVEWDHYWFGTKDLTFFNGAVAGSPTALVSVKQDLDTVKVGINYRFNWLFGKGKAPVVARY